MLYFHARGHVVAGTVHDMTCPLSETETDDVVDNYHG